MRFVLWLVVIAMLGGAGYWFFSAQRAAKRDGATGQLKEETAAPAMGGMDPGTTMNNARNAAKRLEDDGLKRAADLDSKIAP